MTGKGRSGLVKLKHLGVEAHGFRDLYHLTLHMLSDDTFAVTGMSMLSS